jgi:hypothetical protein
MKHTYERPLKLSVSACKNNDKNPLPSEKPQCPKKAPKYFTTPLEGVVLNRELQK